MFKKYRIGYRPIKKINIGYWIGTKKPYWLTSNGNVMHLYLNTESNSQCCALPWSSQYIYLDKKFHSKHIFCGSLTSKQILHMYITDCYSLSIISKEAYLGMSLVLTFVSHCILNDLFHFSTFQSKTHSHITNTSLLRRPTSINATADHTSRIKGKTKSNSNTSHSIAHNGTNHTGRPSNYGTNHTGRPSNYGTNHTGRPSHTNHSHSIASLNQNQSSLLQSSVNWTSLLVEVSNGSHHKSILGHSNNYSKVHLSSNISHHSLSPLERNLSSVSLAVKNLSTSFSYVQNMSFSASYSPKPSFVSTTTIYKTRYSESLLLPGFTMIA